jgi:large exoprotein involved in heme utilization and adhesion
VTGGDISNIFGAIQTTGFGNANLFLMNPAGFLFGPNATVSVGGMVTFTSTDYLRLADNARFNAIPHTRPDLLLSAAPVAAFGFLGSNPGAITVQGSHLSVAEGTGISLVGGDIQITGGTLEAPSGQINLVSIAGRGEAGVIAAGIAATAGTPMGNIVVSGGNQPSDLARFDASGDEGGAVVIRGGQLSLARTNITTDARTANHTGAGIVVEATDSAILDGVILNTRTSSFPNPDTLGGAGPFSLTAPSVTASNVTIDTSAYNEGPGGDVAINIGSLTASNLQIFSFVHGNSPGPASGNVSLHATGDVTLQNSSISTVAFGARDAGQIAVQAATLTLTDGAAIYSSSQFGSAGRGGNIVINVRNLTMQTPFIVPQISTYTASGSHGGDISVVATGAVMISRGAIDARTELGHAEGGSITLSTPHLTLDHFGQITTTTFGDTRAGDISVNVRSLNMLNGGRIGSSACCLSDHGSAGSVNIVASKSISMAGVSDVTIPFPTEISSTTYSAGNAGRVHIVTPTLHLADQAVISASSQSVGHAGTIVIDAARNITTDNGTITAAGQGQGGNVRAWAMRAIS